MKANLGCGDNKLRGYINVDMSKKCSPDIVADVTITPWAWAREFERVEMDNLAEHLEADDFIRVVNECNNCLKPGGTLWIRVPELREGNLMPCFSDPTHVNYFTDQTFQYFVKSEPRFQNFGKDYNIIPWSKLEQKKNGIFLEVTLTK